MYSGLIKAAAKKPRPKSRVITFGLWSSGLVTDRQPEQLSRGECSELLNFVLYGPGLPRTRPGTVRYCSGCSGKVVSAIDAVVKDTWKTFLADDNSGVYRLYMKSGTGVIDIGGLDGVAKLTGYTGKLIISDGDTLKCVQSVSYSNWSLSQSYTSGYLVVNDGKGYRCTAAHTSSSSDEPGTGANWGSYWEQTWIDVVYDNGTGQGNNYQFNNRTGIESGGLALGNGTVERVAQKFQSLSWSDGHKIPPTVFYAFLSKEGDGYSSSNSAIVFRIRKVSDDSVIAEKTLFSPASGLPNTPEEYDVALTSDDITENMEEETDYYASVEFTDGDASNYVKVHYTTTSDPHGKAYTYDGTTWTSDTTKNLRAALKPGVGPKLSYATVFGGKLIGIEGPSSDGHPSYLWYSNDGNLFDWSSADGGGYVQVMDKHAYTFPIGAVAVFYNDIYIFGTVKQPFFAKVGGASPLSWKASPTLQKVSGHYNSVIATPDDIYFRHSSGIDAISTIQAYGDLASVSQTDNIKNILGQSISDNDIAGYEPTLGLYLLKPDGSDYVYAVHTRLKSVARRGLAQVPFSPVSRWRFAFPGTISCFGSGNGKLYIGTDDGSLYYMDDSTVQDADSDIAYKFQSGFETTVFGELQAVKVGQSISGKFGGSFALNLHVNHDRQVYDTVTFSLPWDTSSIPQDMIMDTDEMNFDINPTSYWDREFINFNFRALMVSIDTINLNGAHLYFGPITVLCNQIGGF